MCVCGEVDSNAAVCGGKWASAARAFTLAHADRAKAGESTPKQAAVQFCSAAAAGERQRGLAHTYAYSAMETAPKGRNPQIYYRSQTPLSKCINKFWWPNFIGSFWTGHPERLSWNALPGINGERELWIRTHKAAGLIQPDNLLRFGIQTESKQIKYITVEINENQTPHLSYFNFSGSLLISLWRDALCKTLTVALLYLAWRFFGWITDRLVLCCRVRHLTSGKRVAMHPSWRERAAHYPHAERTRGSQPLLALFHTNQLTPHIINLASWLPGNLMIDLIY